jgi:hypothetical protein
LPAPDGRPQSGFFCQPVLAQPLPERHPVAGRLVDETNTPIKGAVIMIRRQNDLGPATFWGTRLATDADGRFTFPDAEEDSYYISVTAPGYAPLQSKPIVIDSNTRTLDLKMDRLAVLNARFLKPDGTPLAGAKITLLLRSDPQTDPIFQPVTTDANGVISISNIVPGKFTVQAISSGIGVVTLKDMAIRYTDDTHPIDMQLHTGGTLRLVAKEGKPGGRALGGAVPSLIVGKVGSDDPRNKSQLDIAGDTMLYLQHNAGVPFVTRDGDGTLDINDVEPGVYTVRLYEPSYKTPDAQTVEIKPGATTALNFDFDAKPSAVPLTVTIQTGKDTPVANTEFVVQLKPGAEGGPELAPPPAVPNVNAARNAVANGFLRRAVTDNDGKLVLYPIQPNKWRVAVSLPPDPKAPDRPVVAYSRDVTVTAEGGAVIVAVNNPAAKK